MTMDMLVFVITAFCQLKDPKVSEDLKLRCMDHMVNCAIVDGKTNNKQVDLCKDTWVM